MKNSSVRKQKVSENNGKCSIHQSYKKLNIGEIILEQVICIGKTMIGTVCRPMATYWQTIWCLSGFRYAMS